MVTINTVIVSCFLLIKFATAGQMYNVVDYQAAGDGVTDDAQAFIKAWNAACGDATMPTMLIPSGKTFLIGTAMSLHGPCKSPINVEIDGTITTPNKIWTTEEITLILFSNINNLNVYGQGTIDGQGATWWDCWNKNKCVRPYLLDFDGCDNISLGNITLINGPRRHIAFHQCTNLKVEGITVTAPGDSPNTDGINIAESHNIQIKGSTLAIGDDCIAISSGTSNVTISGLTCGPSHGISIGSLGKGGTTAKVEDIHVFDCKISQSLTGARIKTWQGGSGYVKNVIFENINTSQVVTPIVIDQFYIDNGNPTKDAEDAIAISNVKFSNIQGTSTEETAVSIKCAASVPCMDLTFDTISLAWSGRKGNVSATIQNAHGISEGINTPPISLSGN